MLTKCQRMHIDRTDQVTVSRESASAAHPISSSGFMCMSTTGTPAAGSSFGAGKARDVGLPGFVGQVIDVFTVLPQGHTLIVMPPAVAGAYSMRVANEEGADLLLHTKVDHLTGGFMTRITDTSLSASALLVFGPLQLLPTPGVFLTAGLLSGKLPQLFAAQVFERPDTAPGDNQGLPRIGGDGRQVNFSQIDRRLYDAGSFLRLHYLKTDVQFKSVVPDERTGSGILRERDRQRQRGATATHRQDHPTLFLADRLRRPANRVEAFGAPGIFHLHVRMRFAQFACGVDVRKKGVNGHLH